LWLKKRLIKKIRIIRDAKHPPHPRPKPDELSEEKTLRTSRFLCVFAVKTPNYGFP